MSIEASDVKKFSFAQFFARLLARITPSQPLGDLLVTSQPDKQAITIDKMTGEDFLTVRTFVVSVGDHEVRVGSCRQVVKVQSNQKAVVNCAGP